MKPKVSVIIPNYNHFAFLQQRIDSVINQTYTNFDITILDDCSTDESKTIIEQYRNHPKVKQIIYNQTNSKSTFKQWKKGIESTSGEYIWIAESDDIASLSFLQSLTDLLYNHTKCSFVFCDSSTDINSFCKKIHKPDARSENYTGKNFISEHNINPKFVSASSVLFKRERINHNVLTDFVDFTSSGDWLFWTGLALKGDVVRYADELNFYRRHPLSVSDIAFNNGKYVLEGFKLMYYFKKKLRIFPSKPQIKKWASAWAINRLQNKIKNRPLFFYAIKVSILLLIFYKFYIIKYQLYNKFNRNKLYLL